MLKACMLVTLGASDWVTEQLTEGEEGQRPGIDIQPGHRE
jgi:hypothetical protein